MYQKSFVSLSFSANKLHLIQISLNKNKAIRFGVVDIPQGLIVSYKVVDPIKLSQVLKSALKQFGFREKGVGIVVPEFSTYTRTLTLPKLEYKELDEAVRWKMRDFLPDGGSSMIMDWKIIKQIGTGVEVLVVSILEEVLQSYVTTAESAGLLPLVVETPALALARIAGADPDPRLILYSNSSEAVLLALQENEILGSVVSKSSDSVTLTRLTAGMTEHYGSLPVKKILLGGLDITQSTLTSIQAVTKLPVEWLKVNVSGLTPPQIQEFLIPLSLCLINPSEPSDENSINLLPPHWAKLYSDKHTKLQMWSLVLIASVVIWACLLTVIGADLWLNRQIIVNKQDIKDESSTPVELIDRVNKANQVADDIIKINQNMLSPTELINSVAGAKSPGILISTYEVNIEEGSIAVTGTSADRESLVNFKNALEAIPDFGNIDIPLSSLQQESNINFSFSFAYLPAVKPALSAPTKLKL